MKKNFSVREFRTYLDKHKLSKISYWSEDQSWYCALNTCKFHTNFTAMAACENPNVVFLKQDNGSEMLFNGVKRVKVDESLPTVGTIISIYCSNLEKNTEEIVYVLVAS